MKLSITVTYNGSPLRHYWVTIAHAHTHTVTHSQKYLAGWSYFLFREGITAPPAVWFACVRQWRTVDVLCCADEPKQVAISSGGFQSDFQRTWLHTCLCRFWQADEQWTKHCSKSPLSLKICNSWSPSLVFLFFLFCLEEQRLLCLVDNLWPWSSQ